MDYSRFTLDEIAVVDKLIAFHKSQKRVTDIGRANILALLADAPELESLVHSYRVRLKSEDSMRLKLFLKLARCQDDGSLFDISEANFYKKINDSIGARVIHLSLTQFPPIHAALRQIFTLGSLIELEPPSAKVFDTSTESFFRRECPDIKIEINERLYSSVHYVVAPNKHVPWSAEVQVRPIAQEVWGEVDHRFNYPLENPDVACREQIKALAVQMIGTSRTVDAIFRTVEALKERGLQ